MSDLELCDNKTSMVYLFFIQINKISIFWLTTDNFHFRNLFSGALMFFFFSNYWWLLKRTAQTVTLLEKSGIVWSHTGLETFLRRNCKGLWERNNGCVLHSQNSHHFSQKLYYWHPSHPSASLSFDVCLEGVFCMFHQEILLVYATQSERIVASTILNCFIIRIM